MARQNMRPDPSHKHMHIYQTFHRGMNTVDADEKIHDAELANLQNIDLGDRGSLSRRTGFVEQSPPVVYDFELLSVGSPPKAQGLFRYYKEGEGYEEITAARGNLYLNGELQTIEGLSSFQTSRQVEAVQYGAVLYIATGTRLVQYDGEEFKVVPPHRPQPLEALYIGTNGLADDPTNFMEDGVSSALRVDGVTFSSRYGVINEPVTLTAYISAPEETDVEFKFEMRTTEQVEGFWEEGQDWSFERTFTLTPDFEGDYQFRITARPAGTDDPFEERENFVPKFKVLPTKDPNDEEVPVETIHSCNRILVHHQRLVLYGDQTQKDAIFISHLRNPAYFPVPNSLRFENKQRERLVSMVKFRDHLVAFTPSSIQALFGKSPSEYQRVMLSSAIGCIADFSAVVVRNQVIFLSKEGVYALRSFAYNETKANVTRLDTFVENQIPRESDACALYSNDQYHLTFPKEGLRFRYYVDREVWTKDLSEKLDFVQMFDWNGKLMGLRKDTQLLEQNSAVYSDDGYAFEDIIETKYYDFQQPYHDKKMRELQLMLRSGDVETNFSLSVFVDNAEVVGIDTSYAKADEDGNITWQEQTDTNLHIPGGTTLGTWQMGISPFGEVVSDVYKMRMAGRGRLVKIVMRHQHDAPIRLLGLGLQFKVKRP